MDPALKLSIVELIDERVRKVEVRREDFNQLEKTVARLGDAQERTDESLKRLSEAQQRTDESLKRLSEAQQKTDESLQRLSEAQQRTDESLQRTEESLKRLGEAQQKTESTLQQLARQVGRLSDHVGFGLEDIARVVVPGYLLRHHGIQMKEFRRKFLSSNGHELEVDLYAKGSRDGTKIFIIGEVKSRIYAREVRKFAKDLKKLALAEPVLSLMFAYWIHPSASREADKHAIELIASYQR